ncbi:MAG: Gfo/Idh/MocA family oxidoreductase [Kiritimatiellales bacterium]|nr:Gfo/Idh/MocA family oxidoreductase [Kiritimatiellales bacterium]
MKELSLSRRTVLKSTASAATLTGLAGYADLQRESTISTPRRIAPDEKLNIACVGCGGKGKVDVDEVSSQNIVALCDVDWERAKATSKKHPDVPKFKDYRTMLRELDGQIDAVTVTTPDHMHYPVAKMAIEMGKHVYVQKPLTHSVWEARQLAELARKHKVATQMGNQGQASESVRILCEYLWDGAIGPVHEVHVWTNRPIWPQGINRPVEIQTVPKSLDWDLWLGVAPERPYHSAYHPFKWRGWWDFGTGALGDIGCHSLAPIFRALKLTHPVRVEASSTELFAETYPLASIVTYQFPAREGMPPVQLTWYDGGLKPPRPQELEANREWGGGGTLYVGEKGKIFGGRIIPEAKMKKYKQPAKTLPRSPGHYQEWIQACKGGQPGGSDFDFAGPLTEAVLLGNIALQTGKRLEWNSRKLEITNIPGANRFLRRAYRDGWIF